ncbi:hypothetical protein EX30DRAFT_335894 [Ascodesmis nigricans]|uniref:Uncharacterized protein n=1 Tax=Ascodesmis nigricans TaxID=341454 RepID=A0A4S2MJP5_9PEZI|nr:hypothetical protein EX30DRAFT_335894 [Ascodesmis nigricans]
MGQEALRWLASQSLVGVETIEGKKGGYYCLDVALRKGLSAGWVVEEYWKTRATASAKKLPGEPIVRDLLRNLEDRNLCPAIGKAFTSLMTSLHAELKDNESRWMDMWQSPVKDCLADEDSRGRAQIYILPGLFKASPLCFGKFVADIGMGDAQGSRSNGLGEDDPGALLCCLKVGKDLDLVAEVGEEELMLPPAKYPRVKIDSAFISLLLAHAQPHVRLASLNLIAFSSSHTRPFSSASFHLLKTALPPLHNETDPEVRDITIGIIRNLVGRLASSSFVCEKERKSLLRQIAKHDAPPPHILARVEQLKEFLDQTKAFCEWYIGFLETLLRPGRNYQRNSTGVRALSVMIQSGVDTSLADYALRHTRGHGSTLNTGKVIKKGQYTWPEFANDIHIFSPSLKESLIQALFNPYDDIRDLAADSLTYDSSWTAEQLQSLVERGLHAMNTSGRARDADGLARSLGLVFEVLSRGNLEVSSLWNREVPENGKGLGILNWILDMLDKEYFTAATQDFGYALKERPIHGIFSALNYIIQKPKIYSLCTIDDWRKIHRRIFDAAQEIWKLTRDALCDASPEGHVPLEVEEDEDEDSSSQTAMSYAWRAIKESSALVGSIIKLAPYSHLTPDTSILSLSDFTEAGELLLVQLSEIRHRGAFSAVSPSFVGLCNRCFRSPVPGLQILPKQYLERNLSLILDKSSVITRRSGGLPFLIVGILAAESDRNAPLLASTFSHLLKIASVPASVSKDGEKIDLPQVHASNCIRQLFIDSRMTGVMTPYIGSSLSLAVSCFGSEIWAIRNCGVMLFTALTNRLFGTRKSRNDYTFTAASFTTKSFFEKFPTARDVLLQNLKDKVPDLEENAVAVEMVYPALSLLARLDTAPDYSMEDFRPLVKKCMKSRIWKVREMSARAFTALVKPKEVVDTVGELLESKEAGQNGLHGRLCAVRALMERRVLQAVAELGQDIWLDVFARYSQNFGHLMISNSNSLTKSQFIQLILPRLDQILAISPQHPLARNLEDLTSSMDQFLGIINISSTPGLSELTEHLTTLTILLHPHLASSLLSTTSDELTLFTTQAVTTLPTLPPSLPTEEIWSTAFTHPWLLLRAASLNLLTCLPPSSPHYPSLKALCTSPPSTSIQIPSLHLLGSHTTPTTLSTTLSHLHSAASSDNPFPLRSAGLTALSHILHLPTTSSHLPAYNLLYTYLHDDDSELRSRACTIARALLAENGYTLIPTVAGDMLLKTMLTRFSPAAVAAVAVDRIIGATEESVEDPVETARMQWENVRRARENGALFAREKGNLFIDVLDTVEAFAGVMREVVVAGGKEEGVRREVERLRRWRSAVVGGGDMEGGKKDGDDMEVVVLEERWELGERVRVVGEVLEAVEGGVGV